jgi:hypothetical protein
VKKPIDMRPGLWLLGFAVFGTLAAVGCQNTPINTAGGPAPLRIPPPVGDAQSYEDSLTGGEVFAMYCNQCHNARALGERPFSQFQNIAAHMRVRVNLTGEEYAKLLEFSRRWHDVPAPTPPDDPSPKRLIFAQPIGELRDQIAPETDPAQAKPTDAPPQPPQPVPGTGLRPLPDR